MAFFFSKKDISRYLLIQFICLDLYIRRPVKIPSKFVYHSQYSFPISIQKSFVAPGFLDEESYKFQAANNSMHREHCLRDDTAGALHGHGRIECGATSASPRRSSLWQIVWRSTFFAIETPMSRRDGRSVVYGRSCIDNELRVVVFLVVVFLDIVAVHDISVLFASMFIAFSAIL